MYMITHNQIKVKHKYFWTYSNLFYIIEKTVRYGGRISMKTLKNIIILCTVMLSVAVIGHSILKKNSRSKKEVYTGFLNAIQENEMNIFWDSYSVTFFDGRKNAKTPNEKEISEFHKNAERALEIYTKNIIEVENVINKSPKRENLDNSVKNYINFLKEEKKIMEELMRFYKNGLYKEEVNFQTENKLHVDYLNMQQKGKSVFEPFAEEVRKFGNGENR